jgi:phosphoribosylformylglycinamidine cyclo-ligase
VFGFLQERGGVPEHEMWRTFNNGIGMALIVRPADVDAVHARMEKIGETCFLIGEVVADRGRRVELR